MEPFKVVGKSPPRIDAVEKVTGQAKYGTDYKMPGLLYARVLRSPYPHARIISIDTAKAEKLPGVRAVLTPENMPPVLIGRFLRDQFVLCHDNIVRCVGDPVAAVAADTLDIAEEALALIEVKYEELPAVFDAEEAFKPNPPVIIHPDLANYERGPLPVRLDPERPNVCQSHKLRKGDVEKGFREADLIVENRFSINKTQHGSMETFVADAWFESDGSLTIRSGDQAPWTRIPLYARLFNLPPSKVRILTPYVGGGFGGKSRHRAAQVSTIAALLARKSGRPVRLRQTREDTFVEGGYRPPGIVYIKDGVKKDGTLVAREMKVLFEMGGHSGHGVIYARRAYPMAVGTYRVPNIKSDAYSVYTNEPCTAALRGFGAADVQWAIEQQMDIIAEKLGIDPVEIRKKNILAAGETDASGQVTESIGVSECLDKVAEWIGWGEKPVDEGGPWKRGKGIAIANKSIIAGLSTVIMVKVWPDGIIEVRHSTVQLGQGISTSLAQIAAEEFGVSIERIRIVCGDTAVCPFDHGTGSSRALTHSGKALILACRDAKEQLFKMAAPKLGAPSEDLVTADGKVYVKGKPDKSLKISDLFTGAGFPLQGGEVLGIGSFTCPMVPEDPETGQSERSAFDYSHIANAVEVAVDVETGEVRLLRFASAVDVGTPINPRIIEQQVVGGVVLGVGGAISEELVIDRGTMVNIHLTDYRMPGVLDMPSGENTQTTIVDVYNPEGPYGAKGVGELPVAAISPAIAHAVYNAVGVRIKDLPFSKGKVLAEIQKLQQAQPAVA